METSPGFGLNIVIDTDTKKGLFLFFQLPDMGILRRKEDRICVPVEGLLNHCDS